MLYGSKKLLYKCFSLTLIIFLLLLTVSGFSKSYIPVITQDNTTAIVEGCHEQVNHSILKELILNTFQSADDEECCEKICFCCSKNIRGILKFVLFKSTFINPDLKAAFFRTSENLILIKNTLGAFGNKSPPTVLS